jgi:hypothetical protein
MISANKVFYFVLIWFMISCVYSCTWHELSSMTVCLFVCLFRYKLLLEDLLAHTPDDNLDYAQLKGLSLVCHMFTINPLPPPQPMTVDWLRMPNSGHEKSVVNGRNSI